MTRNVDRRPRLLVVDDEPGIRALVQRYGERENFDVIAHAGGRALIGEPKRWKADVAPLDRNMPEIGGLDILRIMRERDPECQVILMTGHATVESAIEAVKLGARSTT